jgi:hypothetical protein
LQQDINLLADLLPVEGSPICDVLTKYATDYVIARRSCPTLAIVVPRCEILSVFGFLTDAIPILTDSTQGYLALTDFIAALCPVSTEFAEYLSGRGFVDEFLPLTLEWADPHACHNILRIARHVWAYESTLRSIVPVILDILEGIPILQKTRAADILYILRDIVCPHSAREMFISKVFSHGTDS